MQRMPLFNGLAFLALLLPAGCANTAVSSKQMHFGFERPGTMISTSLFPADADQISNDGIRTLLEGHVALPDRARMMIVRLNVTSSRRWSPSIAQLHEENVASLEEILAGSARVAKASTMPQLMIGDKPTLSTLRAAAARAQADLLLMYSVAHDYFEKPTLFGPSESNAYCTAEAILFDVRTGTIPFTRIRSENYTATKESSDYSFAETMLKARLAAENRMLAAIGAEATQFLDSGG